MRTDRLFQNNIFFGTIIGMSVLFAWFSYYRIQGMIESSNGVNRSNLITLKIEEVKSSVMAAESAHRGFIITKDSSFLTPVAGLAQRAAEALNFLDSMAVGDRIQRDNLNVLRKSVVARLYYLNKTRRHILSQPSRADSLHTYFLQGSRMMNEIQNQANVMETYEQDVFAQRIKQNKSNTLITPIITLSITLLLLTLVVIAFVFIRNKYRELEKTKVVLGQTDDELKERIREIKAGEEKFKGLLEHAPDAVIIVNTEGCIQIVNIQAEKLFGYERHELIGNRVEILIPEQLRSVHVQHRQDYFADLRFREMGTDQALKARRKDGAEFPVEISLSPLKTDEGYFITAAIRDITRRRQMEAELKQTSLDIQQKNIELEKSNAQLKAFNYIASHDLREPLRKIHIFTGKILESEDQALTEKGKDYFHRISSSVSRMQELIESLFSYSVLGKEGMELARVDLNSILDEVKRDAADLIADKNVTINCQELPVLKADATQMYELFFNLVDNSIKYRKENIPLVISISASHLENHMLDRDQDAVDFLKISFSDNGIGFEPAHADKIFDLFKRLHGKKEYAGTGIGLAICKQVAENHGGYITAEGTSQGGATFHIYLPEILIHEYDVHE